MQLPATWLEAGPIIDGRRMKKENRVRASHAAAAGGGRAEVHQ